MKPDLDLYFPGTVEKGVLTIATPEAFAFYLDHFDGQDVELRVRKFVRSKTKAQSNYFHGVVVHFLKYAYDMIGEDWSLEEIKYLVRAAFLGYEKNGTRFVPSTAELTLEEYSAFIDKCIRLAAEMEVVVPPPTEDPWWQSLMPLKRIRPKKPLDLFPKIR